MYQQLTAPNSLMSFQVTGASGDSLRQVVSGVIRDPFEKVISCNCFSAYSNFVHDLL